MNDTTHVLTITERLIPSNIIGVVKPMLALQEQGTVSFRMRYSAQYREADIQWADVVVLCRSIRPVVLNIVELVQRYQKRLVYDIDDNFFELSVSTALGRYHRHPVHLYVVTELIKNADAVRVYSKPMEKIARGLNPHTYLLKSYFDFSRIRGVHPQKHEKIRIVYATSRGRADTLAQICIPAVARLLAHCPQKVEFYTFGQIPAALKGFPNVYQLKYIQSYDKYLKKFASMGFDIGLAPLLDDNFHNSKTNNKFREYGAMEVCGIYSNAQIYRDCIVDGVNGLVVENTVEEWYRALSALVEDAELRERIRRNAKACVQTEYSMDNTLADWARILKGFSGQACRFGNMLHLDMGILLDDGFPFANLRENGLLTLAGFCGMHYKVYHLSTVSFRKLKQHDLCICFLGRQNVVGTWITELHTQGVKALVVDTLFPYPDTEKYPEVLFTNPETDGSNTFPIPENSSLAGVDLPRAVLDVLSVGREAEAFSELYQRGVRRILEARETEFSQENAVFAWAVLLSRYPGSRGTAPAGGLASRLVRGAVLLPVHILRPVFLSACRIGQKILRPVAGLVQRAAERLKWTRHSIRDYICVNFLKKY